MSIKVLLVAGARPNFMKIAPLYRESLRYPEIDCRIVHTGQHYDYEMSQTFFEELDLPQPHFFLSVGSGTHAQQTARIMTEFESVCAEEMPDLVMVVGDVNSTLACSIVAKKMGIEVAHVEAGLRSFDQMMPEEINRLVTDSISDYLFVTEPSGLEHLKTEGKKEDRVSYVGHVMIDNLLHQRNKLDEMSDVNFATSGFKSQHPEYLFLTLHRPSNVDNREVLSEIIKTINEIAVDCPVVFPVHPRTRKMIDSFNLELSDRILQTAPLGYMEALHLWKDAKAVLTDSGGLQEETTALGVPCVTIRHNTERPVTVDQGTNILAGNTREGILEAYERSLSRVREQYRPPEMWDGRAAERIWTYLLEKESFRTSRRIAV